MSGLRERLLDETLEPECRNNHLDAIRERREWLATRLDEPNLYHDARRMRIWAIASESLDLIILDYSEGLPIETMASKFSEMIDWRMKSFAPHSKYKTEPFYICEKDTYHHLSMLFSLAKLLHLYEQLPCILALLNAKDENNRSVDELYETLIQKLGLPTKPTTACLPFNAHNILLDAIRAKPH
ncbi:MAG: DUF1910 domain-containing protein, partial [Holosporales bacterium]|nr:DUF1910 domain-containing protein [Holosporales bacterium]